MDPATLKAGRQVWTNTDQQSKHTAALRKHTDIHNTAYSPQLLTPATASLPPLPSLLLPHPSHGRFRGSLTSPQPWQVPLPALLPPTPPYTHHTHTTYNMLTPGMEGPSPSPPSLPLPLTHTTYNMYTHHTLSSPQAWKVPR